MPGTEAVAAGAGWSLPAGGNAGRALRAAVAALLALLAMLPLWLLLDRPDTGLAGAATIAMVRDYSRFVWSGTLVVLILAVLLCRALKPERLALVLASAERWLLRPAAPVWAALTAALAMLLASAFTLLVLRAQPNLIDAMAQLLHARYVAAGRLAGPGAELGAFWHLQQSLFTPRGWVSQYPPGHVLLLALAMKLNIVWALGPLLLGLTAAFTTLAAERLLPDRRALARLGGLLVAVSPFLIAHAGAYMNHTTAAAFGALALYCATRSGEGRRWHVGAGMALGAMFITRPLSALTLGIVLAVWILSSTRRAHEVAHSPVGWLMPSAALLTGALPFLLGIAWYNQYFFGSPFTFGYTVALGEAAGLGWGMDPWGNTFGATEALAWTSADLAALNLFLLETPFPVVLPIALWLLLERRLVRGEKLLAAVALAPLVAQTTYWHHGLFMGPRMLNESAPAWCLLVVLSLAWLVRSMPATWTRVPAWSPRVFAAGLGAVAVLSGILVFGPLRLASQAQRPQALEVAREAEQPALVFVHGGWTSRLAMQLAASGMRLDSVETALRQNPTCAVQSWVDAREGGRALPALDLAPRAFDLPPVVEISPGNRIRVAPGEVLYGECARQAAADRFGTIDVSPLLWLGDLPGLPGKGTMFVRDLGPARNRAMLAAHADRHPYVLHTTTPALRPTLAEYGPAMELLWGREESGE